MKNQIPIKRAVAALNLALLLGMLQACGGGSDGTSNPPSVTTDSAGYAIDDYVIGAKVKFFALGSNTVQLETTTGNNGQFIIPGSLANGSYRVEVSGGFEDLDGNSITTSDQRPFTDTLSALLELTTDRTPILVNAITTGLERYAAGDKTKYQDAIQALPSAMLALQTGIDPSKTLGQVLALQRSVGFDQVVQELADDGRVNASAGTLSSAALQSVASAGRNVGVLAALTDVNLRLCIANGLEKDVSDVTRNELLALNRLNCNNAGIHSLAGISATLPNLVSLHLEDNLITDLEPLADLKKLIFLNVQANRITSLTALTASSGEQIAMMVAENCIENPSELNDSIRLIFTGYDTRAKRQFSNCLKNDVDVLAFTLRMKADNNYLLVTRTTYNPMAVCAIDWGDGNTQTIACDGRAYNLAHSYAAPTGLRARFLVNGTVKRDAAVPTSAQAADVSPSAAVIGAATLFTVTGQNLPLPPAMTLGSTPCQIQSSPAPTATGFTAVCTPSGTAGNQVVKIMDSSGTLIDGSRSIAVSDSAKVLAYNDFSSTADLAGWEFTLPWNANKLTTDYELTNGALRLWMKTTDKGGNALSPSFPATTKVKLSVRHLMNGGRWYFPNIGLTNETAVPTNTDLNSINSLYLSFTRSEYASDNRCSSYDIPQAFIPGECLPLTLATTKKSSSFYGQWIVSTMVYDSTTGTVEIDLEGDGVADITGTVPPGKRFTPSRVSFGTAGWWTGHEHLIDWVKVESIQ